MAPKNSGKLWTRDENKTLERLAHDANVPTKNIARDLGRTVNAVRSQAQRHGISLRPKNR